VILDELEKAGYKIEKENAEMQGNILETYQSILSIYEDAPNAAVIDVLDMSTIDSVRKENEYLKELFKLKL
jgi:hypothetical protein